MEGVAIVSIFPGEYMQRHLIHLARARTRRQDFLEEEVELLELRTVAYNRRAPPARIATAMKQ